MTNVAAVRSPTAAAGGVLSGGATADRSGAFDVAAAESLARSLLLDVGTRLAHTWRVADQARLAQGLLPEPWRSALVPAAWLHDVGYCGDLAAVGFHPLDGARYLHDRGWSAEVCRLVAWHTTAEQEARLRGLHSCFEAEFTSPPEWVADVLAWADLTSSPAGERWSPQERLAEILHRYSREAIVHQAVTASLPGLLEAVTAVQRCVSDLSADVGGCAGSVYAVADAEALGGVHVEGLDVGDGHPANLA